MSGIDPEHVPGLERIPTSVVSIWATSLKWRSSLSRTHLVAANCVPPSELGISAGLASVAIR